MKHTLHDRLITAFSFFAGTGLAASALIGYGFMVPLTGSGFTVNLVCVFLTLSAIASGSFSGAMVSEYKRNDKLLLLAVLIPGILMLMLPFYSVWLEAWMGKLFHLSSIVIYGFFVLFVPLSFISQVIPLTVAGLKGGAMGVYARKTGIVFSVVMMGAAFGSFIYPVWVIPNLGLIGSSMLTGFLLAIVPAIQIFRQGWRNPGIIAITIALILPGVFAGSGMAKEDSSFNTFQLAEQWQFKDSQARLNGIWYSDLNGQSGDSTSALRKILANCFPGTEVLVIGCGNESLIKTCADNNLNLTLLDRQRNLLQYFSRKFASNKKVVVEHLDPRIFLNNTTQQFDVILIDMLRGEEVPGGVFTAEAIMKIRSILKPGGLGIVRLPNISGESVQWYGTRSLYKTIRSLGLFTEISVRESMDPSLILFSGSRDAFDDRLDEIKELTYYPIDSIEVKDVRILTDNRPMLGLYYRNVMDSLRRTRSIIGI